MTAALLVVAHPDDELLFAGGLLLARPDWDWTVVAMTSGMRWMRFHRLPARTRTFTFADEWRILRLAEAAEWKAALRAEGYRPDIVFTHNRLGEYGHPHHMAVHAMVHDLYGQERTWDFRSLAPSSVAQQDLRTYTQPVEVTPDKRALFTAVYGHDVLAELTADHPAMLAALFEREWFTGPRPLPQ